MKKSGIIFLLLVALFFIGCSGGGGDDYVDGINNFVGTWSGFYLGFPVTVTVDSTRWTISVPGVIYGETGTYTRNSSTSATLISDTGSVNVGTATLLDNNTLRLSLNNNSIAPETHTLTRLR